MPLYDYKCECGEEIEKFHSIDGNAPICSCGKIMKRGTGSIAFVKMMGYPSRRKWMENWTPESPQFSTGSLHGEKY